MHTKLVLARKHARGVNPFWNFFESPLFQPCPLGSWIYLLMFVKLIARMLYFNIQAEIMNYSIGCF